MLKELCGAQSPVTSKVRRVGLANNRAFRLHVEQSHRAAQMFTRVVLTSHRIRNSL